MERTREGRRLAAVLNRDPHDASWLIWSRGAARGPGGVMHEKTYLFSRVGDASWVTMTGSYNASDQADHHTYALMWQLVGRKDVYDAFTEVGREQRSQRTPRHPFREAGGEGWEAYFLPSRRPRPALDPVLARLRRIPARSSTRVAVSMFSMWGTRGHWLAHRLADLARGGARVLLVAGPTVDPSVVRVLRHGGVAVRPGCFRGGHFAHGKDMTASWWRHGRRQHWTWVGSDNWTSRSMASDQAVLGLEGEWAAESFRAAQRLMLAREDGAPSGRCSPAGQERAGR